MRVAQTREPGASDAPIGVVRSGIAAATDTVCARAAPSHSFLRRAWFAAAAVTGAVTLVGQRPDGTPFAALPLVPMGPRMLGMWMIPGSYWPFRTAVIDEDACAEDLVDWLRDETVRTALGQAWRMGPVYDGDAAARSLVSAARAAGWAILERKTGTAWLIDIAALREAGSWPRRSLRRAARWSERHLGRQGTVSMRFVRGLGWDDSALAAMAAIEANSWIGTGTDGSGAKFLKPEQQDYWRRALADRGLADMLSAAILFVDETPVAFSFDLTVGRLQYGLASSFDHRFARSAPGKLIGLRHLEESVARGVELVDWGCGDSGYKSEFGARVGPDIVDYLFVRSRSIAVLLKPKWERGSDGKAGGDVVGRLLSRRDQLVLAALMTAAAAATLAE